MKNIICQRIFGIAIAFGCICSLGDLDAASVWRVIDTSGNILYLGGSVHALRSTDYPLPPEYARACDASDKLVFEADPAELKNASKRLLNAGQYERGDNLKNHVDPRTYDYVRRFFRQLNVPEQKFAKLRPWCIAFMLAAPQLHGLSPDLGVEGFLRNRAQGKSKPISGLETVDETIKRYSSLSDQQSEVMLLLSFMPGAPATMDRVMKAWRRGEADVIWETTREVFRDAPSVMQREITSRNANWIPKIERCVSSGEKYFVVVGGAHMGGPDGVLNLLRQRGYKIEQL